MRTLVLFLYSVHYVNYLERQRAFFYFRCFAKETKNLLAPKVYSNSKICTYTISHEEIVSPGDRNRKSSSLSFLSQLVRVSRVLMTV